MLSKITLANGNGEDVVLHEDTNASRRLVAEATGLIETPERRESRRVRPQAHGSINESRYQEGSLITISGEVWSTVNIEGALEELRKIKQVCQESLDNEGALLKWTEGVAGLKLQKMVKLDSGIDPILKEAAAFIPYHVQFFAEDPRAYSQTLSTAKGANLTGSAAETTWDKVNATARVTSVAVDSTHIYWTSEGVKAIGRAAIGGGTLEPEWVKTEHEPQSVTVDSSHVYWGSFFLGSKIGRCTTAGGSIENSWIEASAGDVRDVAVNGTNVYWTHTEGGKGYIGRATIAGASVEKKWISLLTLTPTALDLDATFLYFGMFTSVGRVKLTGEEVKTEWIGGTGSVTGLAVSASFVYWLNSNSHSVGRATIAGGEIKPGYIRGLSEAVEGLAVNTEHLYWGENAPYVGRSTTLAGSASGSEVEPSNTGSRPTPLVFKITGPCTYPAVVRASDGAAISLEGAITAGNFVLIDTAARTVSLNGTTNALSMVNSAGTNWGAFEAPPSPGKEKYSLYVSSATAATLEVLYRSAY